jgi:general secretion pathway protein G
MAPTTPTGSGVGLPACAAPKALGNRQTSSDSEREARATPLRSSRGFTFVEMMVVITIIVILITIAIPIYQKSIIRAREAVLRNNLTTLRTVIDNYTYDKMKAPQTLDDLVSDGYLKRIPLDPIANTDQWKQVMEDASQAVNQAEPGIFDVHSTSDKISLDGTPYSSW